MAAMIILIITVCHIKRNKQKVKLIEVKSTTQLLGANDVGSCAVLFSRWFWILMNCNVATTMMLLRLEHSTCNTETWTTICAASIGRDQRWNKTFCVCMNQPNCLELDVSKWVIKTTSTEINGRQSYQQNWFFEWIRTYWIQIHQKRYFRINQCRSPKTQFGPFT